MTETDSEKKKVSQEFVITVKKYLQLDDNIKELRDKMKNLNSDKKECEEFILNYLKALDEDVIDIADGRLKRNVSKTQAPLKKDYIQTSLSTIIGDNIKATEITDKILNSRPMVERETLKRTKCKKS